MNYTKLFVLLCINVLPWFTHSVHSPDLGIETDMTGAKFCEKGKAYSEAAKDLAKHITDFTTSLSETIPDPKTTEAIVTAVVENLFQDHVLKFLASAGPIGGIVAACLSIGKTALEEEDKEKLNAAIADLSKQMNSLSTQVNDGFNKILAHSEQLHFQKEISLPAKTLKGKFLDYMKTFSRGDLLRLRNECKINMPTSIYDKMIELLENNSDKILLNHHYTDFAIKELQSLYEKIFIELLPINSACEVLTHRRKNEQITHQEVQHVLSEAKRKARERIHIISNRFLALKKPRAENAWNTMESRLNHWYDELRKKEDKSDIMIKRFTNRVAERLNLEYHNTEYTYTFGVFMYKKDNSSVLKKKKNRTYHHFACDKSACLHKVDDDGIGVWVFRSLPCYQSRKRQIVTRADTCLQFEMLLYSRFNERNAFDRKNATMVTEMFKRNCKVKNLIGLLRYNGILRAKSTGYARRADINPTNERRVRYRILTEKRHHQIRWRYFDDMVFIADCENEYHQPFNFIDRYCTSESAWPTCRLTEEAFRYHRLADADNAFAENPNAHEPYVDSWGHKALKSLKRFFKKLNPFHSNEEESGNSGEIS